MSNIFDVGIIGAGVAGVFSTLKIAKDHKGTKTIVFDLGRPPAKRKRALEGWLGCFPTGDGKLYQSDTDKIAQLVGLKKAKFSQTFFHKVLSDVCDLNIIKDKGPNISSIKKIKKFEYNICLNDYIQLYPKDIHSLSKVIANFVEENGDITFKFDNEIKKIYKQKNTFVIVAEDQEYKCKKLIFTVGRSGWRWAREVYNDFGIIDNNDVARFGIRVEMPAVNMKDFNKSNCTIYKGSELEIGPLSWFGTIIPEDHIDLAISAFRSNENRWESDKVSFQMIGNLNYPNNGFEQTDRIGNLTFVLSNDRIIKEKITTILNNKSKISILPEYEWLKNSIMELENIIPEITKASFHVPTITPLAPSVILGSNLECEIENMYIAGESAGIIGIQAAAQMGIIAGEAACK